MFSTRINLSQLFHVAALTGLIALSCQECKANEYFVSVAGDDSSRGSLKEPWKTIQFAVEQAKPGDTISVRAGRYYETVSFNVSGNAEAGPIVLGNYQKEKVTLDGSKEKNVMNLIEVADQSFIQIKGMELCNLKTSKRGEVPIGISVSGSSSNIEILNCSIHSIGSEARLDGDLLGRDAHGIAVYGDSKTAISSLTIKGNEVFDLTLGSSEAIVVNGNVDGFEICNNSVHDCDNIGIDCIGFEETCPDRQLDQARNGLVQENHVYNISTSNNPSYDGERSAAGIYVDGGRSIAIQRNRVHNCDFGIEVASEKKGMHTSQIVIRNNLIHQNHGAGLIMGGYDKSSTGSASDCQVSNNTFVNNDTDPSGDEWGQIHLQFRVLNCQFANNILMHNIAKDGNNFFIVQWKNTGKGNKFSNNQYFGTGNPVWVVAGAWTEGWKDFQSSAFHGSDDLFSDPAFKNPQKNDWSLKPDSPCVDSGNNSFCRPSDVDFLKRKRVVGSAVDRGAVEAQ